MARSSIDSISLPYYSELLPTLQGDPLSPPPYSNSMVVSTSDGLSKENSSLPKGLHLKRLFSTITKRCQKVLEVSTRLGAQG